MGCSHRSLPPDPIRGTVAFIALVLAILACGSAAVAQAPDRVGPANRDPSRSLWWNQNDLIEELDLGQRKRRKMDRIFDQHLNRRRALAQERMEYRQAVAAALGAGDWDAARRASEALAEVAGRFADNETEMKVRLLAQLRRSQLDALTAARPRLLQRDWLTQGMGLRARSRSRGPDGATPWPPLGQPAGPGAGEEGEKEGGGR